MTIALTSISALIYKHRDRARVCCAIIKLDTMKGMAVVVQKEVEQPYVPNWYVVTVPDIRLNNDWPGSPRGRDPH